MNPTENNNLPAAMFVKTTARSQSEGGTRFGREKATPMANDRTMKDLRVESDVDPAAWRSSLSTLNGTVFHTVEWANLVIAEQPGTRAEFYTMLDANGAVAGMAAGFQRASSRRLVAAVSRRRWLDALPAVIDNSASDTSISRFVGSIERHSREAGDVALRIGSFASPDGEAILDALHYSTARRLEFELDLSKDEKSLWDGIDFRRRQRIKKAMKSGIEVRELAPDEGASHLRRLQEASFVRIAARGGPALDKRDTRRADPIQDLIGAGLARVVGGFVGGECVTASFFTTFNGLAYHALSGHDDKGLAVQAPSLVLWEMILRFQREGMKRLNFGGCGIDALVEGSPEHGVYTYKKAFGGARLHCASGEKILRPTLRRVTGFLRGATG
jgi:hypothetical protein